MKKLLSGLAALPFLASLALAGQPAKLTDLQMDKVTAGHDFFESFNTNFANITVWVALPAPSTCAGDCTIFGAPPLQITVTDRFEAAGTGP